MRVPIGRWPNEVLKFIQKSKPSRKRPRKRWSDNIEKDLHNALENPKLRREIVISKEEWKKWFRVCGLNGPNSLQKDVLCKIFMKFY